jgi:hypothetical protein
MATPHISGAMALLWSAVPGLRHQITASRNQLNNSANGNRYRNGEHDCDANCDSDPNGYRYCYAHSYSYSYVQPNAHA